MHGATGCRALSKTPRGRPAQDRRFSMRSSRHLSRRAAKPKLPCGACPQQRGALRNYRPQLWANLFEQGRLHGRVGSRTNYPLMGDKGGAIKTTTIMRRSHPTHREPWRPQQT